MSKWTIFVCTIDQDILDFEIDPNSTFLDFRKMVADKIPGVNWQDLVLVSKKDYNSSYNSKKICEIDKLDIYDHCTLYVVIVAQGGNVINSLK